MTRSVSGQRVTGVTTAQGSCVFSKNKMKKIANGTIEEEDAHYLHLDTLGIVNGLVDIVLQGEAWIEFSLTT